MANIVILSSRALFAEGVATWLQQQANGLDTLNIDAQAPDALAQVAAACPATVILDVTDEVVTQQFPLSLLLNTFPSVRIICLDPQQNSVQVVTSEQRTMAHMQDLIEVVRTTV